MSKFLVTLLLHLLLERSAAIDRLNLAHISRETFGVPTALLRHSYPFFSALTKGPQDAS